MTDKTEDTDVENAEGSEELFDAITDVLDDGDYDFDTIVVTCLEMIVSIAKISEDDEYARSLVPLLISAAHYLDRTGAGDEPIEESRIIRLN